MFDYFAQAGQRANEGSIRLEACEVIIAIDLENPRESLLLPLPLLLAPAAAPGRCPWPLGGARGGGRLRILFPCWLRRPQQGTRSELQPKSRKDSSGSLFR